MQPKKEIKIKMNPLQKNQLRLAYKRDYDIYDKNFVNIDEIKRAN